MNKPLLSILIPTVVGREAVFAKLYTKIINGRKFISGATTDGRPMYYSGELDGGIHLAYYMDDKTITIGEKREELYKMAKGLYSWQIDDDDDIADNAIEKILEAIKQQPDCITFRENCMIDGKYYSSNHSLKYSKWADNEDGFNYVRSPFYKDVIRTDIARSVPFEHIRWNEDERWSYALLPHLHSEIHIDEELYFYIHNSTDTIDRYGFNREP